VGEDVFSQHLLEVLLIDFIYLNTVDAFCIKSLLQLDNFCSNTAFHITLLSGEAEQ